MSELREELKFVVHHSVHDLLLARWQRYLVRAPFTNEHAVYPVLTQYYDSPVLGCYQEKLDGVALRHKLRLRTYGQRFAAGQATFLELKQRENDRVRKQRYRIADFDPAIHLDPESWSIDDPALEGAFMTLKHRYRLRASAQTWFQREAWQGAVEDDVRVTFDSCLLGLHPGERVTRGLLSDRSRQLFADTLQILEVKASRGIPRWFHEGVIAAELRRQTLPKYVTAVELLGLPELIAAGVYA